MSLIGWILAGLTVCIALLGLFAFPWMLHTSTDAASPKHIPPVPPPRSKR